MLRLVACHEREGEGMGALNLAKQIVYKINKSLPILEVYPA